MANAAPPDKRILLSFDVEEFDIPQEYGQTVPQQTQLDVSARGLAAVVELVDRLGITATFFTTANFALHHAAVMRDIASRHEIASHQYWHSRFDEADLLRSRLALQEVTGQRITGFRRARLAPTRRGAILDAGYTYNSSENPIWLPGRYNHFFQRRTAYLADGLLNIPVSASPGLRIPLFWLAIKNFPWPLIKAASAHTLGHDGYLNLYFHPWEFTDLSAYRSLPAYIRRHSGAAMLARLEHYILWLKRKARFVTLGQFDQQWRAAHAGA
ncbi:MAG: polysaccharide deacetylase family protein [Phycisphaeraceae bacterium]